MSVTAAELEVYGRGQLRAYRCIEPGVYERDNVVGEDVAWVWVQVGLAVLQGRIEELEEEMGRMEYPWQE